MRKPEALCKNVPSLRAMSHITGGGLPENLERLLTFGNHGAALKVPYWKNEVVQKVLAHADHKDAIDTFNMGFGWVAIVAAADAGKALACGKGSVVLGEIDGSGHVTVEIGG